MWDNISHKKLYLLVLFGAVFLLITALGGGLFNQSGLWFEHWQHKAFRGLCHQDPQRAFWLAGTPMSVCTRCFGIYAGFFVLWVIFPLADDRFQQTGGRHVRLLLFGAVAINVIDFIGNFIGFWQNTLMARFGMGSVLGLSVALVIGYEFLEKTQTNLKGIHYGTNTSG